MHEAAPRNPHHVVIVGGGIAALELVLALHELAGDRVQVTLVSPRPNFSLRPLSVLVPFGRGTAPTLPLDDVLADHGGVVRHDTVESVDAGRRVVRCASGSELEYDTLVLAPGARAVPAFDRGLTFDPFDADALAGVLSDLERGFVESVAFVVPSGVTWSLPMYELALMTAERVARSGLDDVGMHFVSPESRPLAIFGHEASDAVSDLLAAAGISFRGSATPHVPKAGCVELGVEGALVVGSIVALSRMRGPGITGVPTDEEGFIETDAEGHVTGLPHVWAVGDATQQPIKQGGLACQQADTVAARVAAAAGADVLVGPPVLELRGRLLAGRQERFLHRPVGTATSEVDSQPLWWPPAKVASVYLAPYLEERGVIAPAPPEPRNAAPVDVRVPIDWERSHRDDVLGLSSLGPVN
jgi:sulfide:quinone oxidoreductase